MGVLGLPMLEFKLAMNNTERATKMVNTGWFNNAAGTKLFGIACGLATLHHEDGSCEIRADVTSGALARSSLARGIWMVIIIGSVVVTAGFIGYHFLMHKRGVREGKSRKTSRGKDKRVRPAESSTQA